MRKKEYIHEESVHNMNDPRKIVPIVLNCLPYKVNSVIDFGCGTGTWLRAFKESGVKDILGIDGNWCNRNLLFENIDESEFMNSDLEKLISLPRSYDLVVSLEVAEHLSEQSADVFVKSLISAGNTILFSAAIPGQGGFNHINEQWPSYWICKFQEYGYCVYDIIRDQIADDEKIFSWYKQNMILFVHKDIKMPMDSFYSDKYIFLDYYKSKLEELEQINSGKRGISFY